LTSLFSAGFAVSQRQNQSVLAYPTPTEAASSAVAQNLSQTGSQITRRNLNVQPTIRVPGGYKFTLRLNRDILFEEPYKPISATAPLPERMLPERSLQQRTEPWGK
jgi:type IV secretory pathway VirB10-like protein